MKNIENPPLVAPKILASTRLKADISGDVAYTGVGFKPKAIVLYLHDPISGASSHGYADGTSTGDIVVTEAGSTGNGISALGVISGAGSQSCVLKQFDNDGFTLTWTKGGVGTTNDIQLRAICFR